MSIPTSGPRQVYLYNHSPGRPHWTQGGHFFYDRRLSQQVALGGPFHNHPQFAQPPPPPPPAPWFRGPVVAGPPSPRRYQNFRVNITWNAPYHNNVNIHFGGGGGGGGRQVNNSHRSHNNMRPNNNNNVVGGGGGGGGGRGGGGGGPGGERSFSGDAEEDSDICFICGDFLQNSNEHGVHFCDGGRHCSAKGGATDGSSNSNDNNNLDGKLDSILQSFKGSLKNDYQVVSEALEKYFTERVTEISTIHRQLLSDRQTLSTLRKDLDRRSEELQLWDKELASGQKKLTEEREKLDVDSQKEKEEIARQWQQLRDEIARMEELHSVQKGRIRLDVGGHIYTTSMLTLTRDADSMLAAMFSGRHEVCKEEDGTVFIDRDGTHFRYILNYLRDGGVTVDALPRNKQILRELRNEATYFQLHGLVQQIEKLL